MRFTNDGVARVEGRQAVSPGAALLRLEEALPTASGWAVTCHPRLGTGQEPDVSGGERVQIEGVSAVAFTFVNAKSKMDLQSLVCSCSA